MDCHPRKNIRQGRPPEGRRREDHKTRLAMTNKGRGAVDGFRRVGQGVLDPATHLPNPAPRPSWKGAHNTLCPCQPSTRGAAVRPYGHYINIGKGEGGFRPSGVVCSRCSRRLPEQLASARCTRVIYPLHGRFKGDNRPPSNSRPHPAPQSTRREHIHTDRYTGNHPGSLVGQRIHTRPRG